MEKLGNKSFATRIKAFREEKGISQEDLASMFGYKKQAVSHWENNGKVPRTNVLEKLAGYFNTSSDYLLGFTDDPTPRTNATEQKKPKDLLKIIEQEDYTLNGQIATQEDRQRLKKLVEVMYWDAKSQYKRK
ncbi:helix-turn-helix domain-containing protein [Sporomusa malonica]|uniref:Transcriptional regulator, contains XRE-family HTH domain n=1 Tax=Sporomusa malonica TaxID=112901 RepID=A0A1W2B389_9FIRM|nr:helix-turn-helix transcriptional regulator [Sporomusa malonica]SMC67457.1 Transcriptional regulator, contains XRE-family HTH domain [Sporomusa malonica]